MSTTTSRRELTVRAAAQRVGRAPETIRRWIWSGKLRARKRGNVYYVREGELDAVAGGSPASSQVLPRSGPTLSDWVREVEQWHSGSDFPRRGSAVELLLEDRAERAGR
jgi:excisionase family DNA binding protein